MLLINDYLIALVISTFLTYDAVVTLCIVCDLAELYIAVCFISAGFRVAFLYLSLKFFLFSLVTFTVHNIWSVIGIMLH
jgi:hypothetical protein